MENLLSILSKIPDLRVLDSRNNNIQHTKKLYRKQTISKLSTLTYLDNSPVTDNQRLRAIAFLEEGQLGEERISEQIRMERAESHDRYLGEIKQSRDLDYIK